MTARTFAVLHGRGCLWELARYLRAGAGVDQLEALVADVFAVLEIAGTNELRGGVA